MRKDKTVSLPVEQQYMFHEKKSYIWQRYFARMLTVEYSCQKWTYI